MRSNLFLFLSLIFKRVNFPLPLRQLDRHSLKYRIIAELKSWLLSEKRNEHHPESLTEDSKLLLLLDCVFFFIVFVDDVFQIFDVLQHKTLRYIFNSLYHLVCFFVVELIDTQRILGFAHLVTN